MVWLSREDDATDFKYLAAKLRLKWRRGVLAVLLGSFIFGSFYCFIFIVLPPTLYESVLILQVEYTARVGEEKEGSYWNVQQWNTWLDQELSEENEQSLGSKLSEERGLFQESEDTEGSLDRILGEAITLTMPWDHSLISLQVLTKDATQTLQIMDILYRILPSRIKQTAITTPTNQDGAEVVNLSSAGQVPINEPGSVASVTEDSNLASIEQVRVVDTTPVHVLWRDTRPLNAFILGFVMSALFIFTMMALRELRSDRIELPMDAWVQFRLCALPWETFLRIKQRSSVKEDSSTAFDSTYYFIGNKDDYTQLQEVLQKELSAVCYYIDMKGILQEDLVHEDQCDKRHDEARFSGEHSIEIQQHEEQHHEERLLEGIFAKEDGEPQRSTGTLILQSGHPMTATLRKILKTGMIPLNHSTATNGPQYFDRMLLWKVNPKLFRFYYRN
ncbi:MAG: hypothetical protein LBM60_09480 [Clostridium sp.]|jgi:hypothetical protein|nr:hypothetical protein [Clostridium sp.]